MRALHRLGVVEVDGEDVGRRSTAGCRRRRAARRARRGRRSCRTRRRSRPSPCRGGRGRSRRSSDVVAAGEGAGDADRVHRRLRAGVRVAPLGQAGSGARAPRRRRSRPRSARRSACPARSALGDRAADRRVGVALDHRAEAVVEVPHLVAVDVPDLRARCRARGRSATARAPGRWRRRRRTSVRLARSNSSPEPAVRSFERPRLALGQLGDPLAVDGAGGRGVVGDGHLPIIHLRGPRIQWPWTGSSARSATRSATSVPVRHAGGASRRRSRRTGRRWRRARSTGRRCGPGRR